VAAVPSIGRADRVAGAIPPEADLTQALYERYSAQIFRFCLHQLGSREEAEDAVQSTFLNAFRGIKRGIVPEQESAWLFKIAHNVCLSRRRSTWRRGRIESPADFELVEELTPAPSRLADELVGLQDVLEQMPESQRRAILLREWQGLSYREIAEELELSQTAVETLIFRARRSLAKGLEEPPAPAQRRRMIRGADLGNVLAGLKSILLGSGAAAVKVAAVVAVVSAGTVAVAPATHHARSHAPASVQRATPPASLPRPTPASLRPAPATAPATKPSHHAAAAPSQSTPPAPVIAEPSVPAESAPVAPPPAEPAASQASVGQTEAPAPPASRAAPPPVTPPPPVAAPDDTSPPADPGQGKGPGNGNGDAGAQGQGQSQSQSGQGQGQGQGSGGGSGNGAGNGNGGQGGGNGRGHGH
jgi:RNA polymerase sigma factor (sigma-70 family)